MDPIKLFIDSAGPSGIAIIAILSLLLSGQLALGREVKREREITTEALAALTKLADQVAALATVVRDRDRDHVNR